MGKYVLLLINRKCIENVLFDIDAKLIQRIRLSGRPSYRSFPSHVYQTFISIDKNNWNGCKYKAADVDCGKVDRTGFGSRVDGASKLLIDSALFLELREGGVSCSRSKVFVWSRVTQCKDPETPGAHLQLTFSVSDSYY